MTHKGEQPAARGTLAGGHHRKGGRADICHHLRAQCLIFLRLQICNMTGDQGSQHIHLRHEGPCTRTTGYTCVSRPKTPYEPITCRHRISMKRSQGTHVCHTHKLPPCEPGTHRYRISIRRPKCKHFKKRFIGVFDMKLGTDNSAVEKMGSTSL